MNMGFGIQNSELEQIFDDLIFKYSLDKINT